MLQNLFGDTPRFLPQTVGVEAHRPKESLGENGLPEFRFPDLPVRWNRATTLPLIGSTLTRRGWRHSRGLVGLFLPARDLRLDDHARTVNDHRAAPSGHQAEVAFRGFVVAFRIGEVLAEELADALPDGLRQDGLVAQAGQIEIRGEVLP